MRPHYGASRGAVVDLLGALASRPRRCGGASWLGKLVLMALVFFSAWTIHRDLRTFHHGFAQKGRKGADVANKKKFKPKIVSSGVSNQAALRWYSTVDPDTLNLDLDPESSYSNFKVARKIRIKSLARGLRINNALCEHFCKIVSDDGAVDGEIVEMSSSRDEFSLKPFELSVGVSNDSELSFSRASVGPLALVGLEPLRVEFSSSEVIQNVWVDDSGRDDFTLTGYDRLFKKRQTLEWSAADFNKEGASSDCSSLPKRLNVYLQLMSCDLFLNTIRRLREQPFALIVQKRPSEHSVEEPSLLMSMAMTAGVVPVFVGPPSVLLERYLPPESFVDARILRDQNEDLEIFLSASRIKTLHSWRTTHVSKERVVPVYLTRAKTLESLGCRVCLRAYRIKFLNPHSMNMYHKTSEFSYHTDPWYLADPNDRLYAPEVDFKPAWKRLTGGESFSYTPKPSSLIENTNPTHEHKLAIVVGVRNRDEQLAYFLPYFRTQARMMGISYAIMIVQQEDSKDYNRLANFNVGVAEVDKIVEFDFDYYAFVDVDFFPAYDVDLWAYPDVVPVHLSGVYSCRSTQTYMGGGGSLFTSEQFRAINGFSNLFWGWGQEDHDIQVRLWMSKDEEVFQTKGRRFGRISPLSKAKYKCWELGLNSNPTKRINRGQNAHIVRAKIASKKHFFEDDGLSTCEYKVLESTRWASDVFFMKISHEQR